MKEFKKEIHRSVLFKFKEKDLLLDKKKSSEPQRSNYWASSF